MILVKIELISAIHPSRSRELGRMTISNTGEVAVTKGGNLKCDYHVKLMRRGTTSVVQRKGWVRNYPREAYTVWELVKRALLAILGKDGIHPGTPAEFNEEVLEETK